MFRNFILTIVLVTAVIFSGSLAVYAQTTECNPSTSSSCPPKSGSVSLENPFKATCGGTGDCNLVSFLTSILENIIMPIAGVAIVLSFIATGFKFVMARGNAKELDTAKNMLKLTIAGAVLLLGATAISKVIEGTINQFK